MSIGAQPSFSAMATYPGGFAGGLVVQNLPLVNSWPGRVFWVDSNNGSDNNRGTFARPFASITGAQAIMSSMMGASATDLLVAKPNHRETVSSSTGMVIKQSGLTIVGMGAGDARPTITLDTANTATISIYGASNVSFQNFKFVGNFLNIGSLFTLAGASVTASISGNVLTVTAVGSGTLYAGSTIAGTGIAGTFITGQLTGTAGGVGTYQLNRTYSSAVSSGTVTTVSRGFCVNGCEMRDTSAILGFAAYVTVPGVANAANGLTISNNTIVGTHATNACALIAAVETNDRVSVTDNYFATLTTSGAAVIPITAAKVLTNAMILRNTFNPVGAAGTTTGLLVTTNQSTNSGLIAGNFVQNLDATTPLLATASSGFIFMENYYQSAADKSGAILPATS